MAPKEIRPETETISCAVCGRRLLRGERPEIYLAGGERRTVCELCTVRANHQGWIRESAGPQLGHRGPGREERRPRFRRLRARREQGPGNGRPAPADGPTTKPAGDHDPVSGGVPDGRSEPRNVYAVPTSDELKAARALELFNASEHTRTVAGVARSLGPPAVVIRPSGEHASVVHITVVWELCWYRYEVDLASEAGHAVRLIEQGSELSELPSDQPANAAADDRGLLVMAQAGR
jgi:hypothetical protein